MQTIPLRIGLKQSNMDKLHDELMAISHPDSPVYGQHWSAEQVKEFFRPSQESHDSVNKWLVDSGFKLERIRVSPGGNWIEVEATVSEVEDVSKDPLLSLFLPTRRTAVEIGIPRL
jgi:tripeptidyl-peptidase I